MIRLCLDNITYLSESFQNPINLLESGSIYGKYYGSSTRIDGGEIWHPTKGYLNQNVHIQVKLSDKSDWITIFNQYVNFCEEFVKIKQHENNDLVEFEKKIADTEGRNPNITDIMDDTEQNIQKIRSGESCDICFGSKITLRNDLYEVVLHLRDLHRFEGEVQISGCTYNLIK